MKFIQSLNGNWQMNEAGKDVSYPLTIPGSVLSCLLDNHQIEDPYYRDHEYEVRDLFYRDYEFTRTFEVTQSLLEQTSIQLVCYGLDTLCDIFVNEKLVASTNNMHRTWSFSLKEILVEGMNAIRIVCKSPLNFIQSYPEEPHKKIEFFVDGTMKNAQYIRKAHSMFGWDWGPQLPDAGIFRDIQLEAFSLAVIQDVIFTQHHIKNDNQEVERVEVEIDTKIQQFISEVAGVESNYQIQAEVSLRGDNSTRQVVTVQSGERIWFKIENPQLWWPNEYGKQPLYMVNITLLYQNEVIDTKEYKIGLRTLTVSQEEDQWGTEFALCINGIKIFTKGANYIPDDCIYSRITKERLEYMVKASVRAHFNCLRIWGGGFYPSDEFYDLCDEHGLIVWQDLMYACNIYDVSEEFEKNIIEETKDNVKRLRHHASLGLWCGNNEIETAWLHWDDFKKHSSYLKADYIKQFEYLLPKATKEMDSQTFYWPSSPSSGGCFDDPGCEGRGDTHYWDVWHGQKPFTDYQKHFFRFCSEFGFQSFPCSKTVETFTVEEDRNIFSKVMESHQKNQDANGKILFYISENFRYPKDFDSLLYVSQVLQAVAIKSGVEHWRRNRGRCMGTLYWQLNDNWPVASWSSIDYFGRYKALHYMAMEFYAQEAGSTFLRDKVVEVYGTNENRTAIKGNAVMKLKKLDFTLLDQVEKEFVIPALGKEKIMEKDFAFQVGQSQNLFVETTFFFENGRSQTQTEVFTPYKYMELEKPRFEVEVTEHEDRYEILVQSQCFAPFVQLDFKEEDVIFSNNYFHITSEEGVRVQIQKQDVVNGKFKDGNDLRNKLTILSLRESY